MNISHFYVTLASFAIVSSLSELALAVLYDAT